MTSEFPIANDNQAFMHNAHNRRMKRNTERSQKWRKEQREAGRIPRLVWLDSNEWTIVKSLIDKLKKLRGLTPTPPTE